MVYLSVCAFAPVSCGILGIQAPWHAAVMLSRVLGVNHVGKWEGATRAVNEL